MGEEIKSGELKSKTSRRTNVNTYEKARFYGNLMIAKASEPFGTKRSQVQILSPRPCGVSLKDLKRSADDTPHFLFPSLYSDLYGGVA